MSVPFRRGFGEFVRLNLFLDSVDTHYNTFSNPAFIDTVEEDFRLAQNTRVASIGTAPTIDELRLDLADTPRPSPVAAPPDLGALESTYQLPHAFLCGDLSGNIPAGTYIIPCDLTVPAGETVTIDAGATFLFAGEYSLRVDGLLFALGESGDSIVFTTHPAFTGRWAGLHFIDPTPGSMLATCVFENGLSDTTAGGFLSTSRSSLQVSGCAFRNIEGVGGVMHVTSDSVTVGASVFTHCNLPTCILARGGALTLHECDVRSTVGGLMLRSDSRAYVQGCEFAQLTEPAFLVTDVSTLLMIETSVRNCRGNSSGMAVHGGAVTALSSSFAQDTSGSGSVVQLAGGDCTFRNCDFDSCGTQLLEGGGVVSVTGTGRAVLDSCRFRGNMAANLGGVAVRVSGADAEAQIAHSDFVDNAATGMNGSGGALYFDSGVLDVSKSTFSGNVSELGGAAALLGDGATIRNCVMYQNSAGQGSAVFMNHSSATVTACILAESSGSPAIGFWGDCAAAAVDHSSISGESGAFQFEDGSPDHGPHGIGHLDSVNFNQDSTDVYGNLFADPQLIDPAVGNFHIAAESPCVNAGSLFAPFDPDSSINDIGVFYSPIQYTPSSSFALLMPVNGATILGQHAELSWQVSRDTDDLPVNYYLVVVANNPLFDRPSVEQVTSDTALTIPLAGGVHYWQVTAFSAQGGARYCNASFTFTRPETLTPFDLIEPITGHPHPVNWPLDFRWQHSIDPSGQNEVTYSLRLTRGTAQLNIPLDTANHFTTIPADWNIFSGDQIRWSVFAHIESPDTSIESLSRNWLFLTDSAASVADDAIVISEFVLHPVYPNPFNSKATLTFDVPRESFATLRIFDIAGREVDVILSGRVSAGRHRVEWDAERFASGTYFVRLESETFVRVRKLILLK
ncbi:MAG: right-handed parallel beta-helix repeat-containing protein [bacterium]|nr:right-handed parallel beta-helix repeat-containing protein [bacterium]